MNTSSRPKIAIIDTNTLAVLGLKQLLLNIMPIMTVDTFGSMTELEANQPDAYMHYFVSETSQLSDFHSLCINQPEPQLIRQLLQLEQHAHGQGQHLPPIPRILQHKILTDREIEVMALIVQGYINKEIADRLNIGLTTVITHRKNIMEKLGMKSVSALTIYAVMHGYVDINKI